MDDSSSFSKKFYFCQSYLYVCYLTRRKTNWREMREETSLGLDVFP